MIGSVRRVPIPSLFHSDETGSPFAHCLCCDADLLDGDVPYLIEKAYRAAPQYGAREVVFEYALCLDCYSQLSARLSTISRQHIQAYVDEHTNPIRRALDGLSDPNAGLERWLAHCMIDGTPRTELKEYQYVAHCEGDRLVLSHLPAVIGGPAIDAMVDLLSAATLDELDGFHRDFLGPSPDLEELLTGPAHPAVLL